MTGLRSRSRSPSRDGREVFERRSARIGLSVHSDSVRVVGIRDRRRPEILWMAECAVTPDTASLAAAIESVLAGVPRSRWPWRPSIVVAVGPGRVQTKLLTDPEGVRDPRTAETILRDCAGSLFLANGAPLATTVGRLTSEGAWVAAYDGPVIEAIASACRAASMRLAGVVPTVIVIPFAIAGSRVLVHDGEVVAEVTLDDGELRRIERRLRMGEDGANVGSLPPDSPLARFGEGAWRFAEAYAAAIAPTTAWTTRSVTAVGNEPKVIPRWRAVAALAAACAGVAFALVAPGLAARTRTERAERAMAALAAEYSLALDTRRRIEQVTLALDEVARFSEERRSSLALLAALTAVLPAESAIVTLKVERTGGSVVALAPRAALIVTQLERVETIIAAEIIGPVTREVVAGRELERVTVRFRLTDRPRSGESS